MMDKWTSTNGEFLVFLPEFDLEYLMEWGERLQHYFLIFKIPNYR